MARVRSPNYPALSLPDAIERIRAVYDKQQGTPEPREVVFEHMGYSGPSGRSMKAISALIKYGFLEDTKDGTLRVSNRAISILYPDPDEPNAKQEALMQAAREPSLFAKIFERWDGRPSESSLEAFLIREGFNKNSVDSVSRAFYDTFDLVSGIEKSYDSPQEGHPRQGAYDEDADMQEQMPSPEPRAVSPAQGIAPPTINSTKPVFDFETVAINTKIDNQEDLAELIGRLEQVKSMLPSKLEH